MVIDFHTHIFPPRLKAKRELLCQRDPFFSELYSNPKAKMVDADELIASMDSVGIDRSAVMGFCWSKPELCVEHNSYILESVARYPERLTGFIAVQTATIDSAVREIERYAAAGLKGIGEMRLDIPQYDFFDEQVAAPFAETVKKHNLILLIHASEPVGHRYAGKGSVTPDKLYSFIARYPELTVVCAHWGGGLPFYGLMPEVKQALQNVYFDTAASPFLYSPEIYQHVIDIIGANKILFGTDYPLMPPKRVLDEIDSLQLSQETRELILAGNGRRLLGLNRKV